METKQIAVLEKKVMPLVQRVETMEITSAADMKEGTVLLSQLNTYLDTVIESRKKITDPANLVLKNAREMFDPIEKPATAAIKAMKQRMADYQTEQLAIAEAEEEKLAARIGKGKGKLKMETAARKADEIERPDDSINTEAGSLKFRKMPVLEITDLVKIPDEYWIVDEKKLTDDLKAGKEIPGAKMGSKLVPVNSR